MPDAAVITMDVKSCGAFSHWTRNVIGRFLLSSGLAYFTADRMIHDIFSVRVVRWASFKGSFGKPNIVRLDTAEVKTLLYLPRK